MIVNVPRSSRGGDRGRHQFGRITLWLTLVIVGTLTMGLTIEARLLNVGIPPEDSTQIAELAPPRLQRRLMKSAESRPAGCKIRTPTRGFLAVTWNFLDNL